MQKYNKLNRFPIGAIRADGFLKEQLIRGKHGMAGHLYELEPGIIVDPYIKKSCVSAWTDVNQDGWGGEISANYWNGYIQHAFILNDEEMIERATKWVDEMLQGQRKDGYLGTYNSKDSNIYDDFNGWSTAGAMRALLNFYDITGREDVLKAVHRCLLWFANTWTGEKKTTYADWTLRLYDAGTKRYRENQNKLSFCKFHFWNSQYFQVCRNFIPKY